MALVNDLSVSSVFRRAPRRRLGPLRRLAAGLVAAAGVVGLWRLAGWALPKLRTQAGQMCERMIEEMPETFPPKRLFTNIETIREQNERILQLLEKSENDDSRSRKARTGVPDSS